MMIGAGPVAKVPASTIWSMAAARATAAVEAVVSAVGTMPKISGRTVVPDRCEPEGDEAVGIEERIGSPGRGDLAGGEEDGLAKGERGIGQRGVGMMERGKVGVSGASRTDHVARRNTRQLLDLAVRLGGEECCGGAESDRLEVGSETFHDRGGP